MSTIRIVVVDDSPVVRRNLMALLQSVPDFSLVGSGSDGLEAAELVERLQPDVLITDITMPHLDGLEVARRAARQSPRTRVLVLSMHSDPAYALAALNAGAMGYVIKGCSQEELIRAIREVVSDRQYVSPPLLDSINQTYSKETKKQ